MRLEHYSVDKLKREIIDIVNKHITIAGYNLFFFGSRVTDKGDERSDIDIGIYGKEKIPFGQMARIKEELNELNIFYKIDFVDFSQVSDDFKKVALDKIEYIIRSAK